MKKKVFLITSSPPPKARFPSKEDDISSVEHSSTGRKPVVFLNAVITSIVIFIIFISPTLAQEEATNEGETIREKVRQKLEEVKNQPKAYIGTITDKTETGVQIKTPEGDIQQTAINEEETSFVKINKKTSEITFDDVAIGDFIVAMGYKDEKDILDAKRVLLTSPIEKPSRKIIFGSVTEIVKKEITITTSDDESTTLTFPRRWKGPEIDEVKEGDTVITVYFEDEGKLTIRTIEIASSTSPTPDEAPSTDG